MTPGLRAGAVALALVAASYGVVGSVPGAAAAPASTVAQTPPPEVATADTTTPLPDGDFRDILVDDVHQQVFVAMTSGLVVTDFDGVVTRTIPGFADPASLTLSGDATTLYVAEQAAPKLGVVDTRTYQTTHVSLPETHWPNSVAFTGGKVWYSYRTSGNYYSGAIGVYDPATGVARGDVFAVEPGEIRALPDHPDRLVHMEGVSTAGAFHVYDVSSPMPTEVATGGTAFCDDAALTPDGARLITACEHAGHHGVYHTSDLSVAPRIESGGRPNSVAVSADGRFVAAGTAVFSEGDAVFVRNIQDGTPGTAIRTYTFGYYSDLQTESLAFTDTGRLLAVTRDGNTYDEKLHVMHEATKIDTSVTVTVPKTVEYRGTVEATGTLNKGPGVETTLTLTRTDRDGVHNLGTVPVAADGGFGFSDRPGLTGPATYQLSYPGDETHASAQAAATVRMRPLPYDVDADGYADAIVGVPGEDLGSVRNAGQFHVLYGTASGTTGTGSSVYHQDTPGVPGSPESGDQLGLANAGGDFNGDGYADVAVSANRENIGSVVDAGLVLVFYGSPDGLRTDKVTSLEAPATERYFGNALAAGDFDGDGHDDVAVGGPWRNAGSVFVFRGGDGGVATTGTEYSPGSNSVPGRADYSEGFGWALSAGDVNADGKADLAIGSIYDWEDRDWSTGSVTVLYGATGGLNANGDGQWFSKDSTGVPGGSASFNPDAGDESDGFGSQVALADSIGDGAADLAVGAPGSPVTVDGVRKRDAGTVTLLYSSGTRISTSGAVQVNQQTGGMPGSAGQEDWFGTTLAAGDSNGDGRAELAIYSPGDTYVTVVPGAEAGLAFGGAEGWTQNSSGIPGGSEAGDWWGDSLRFADVKGTGYAALIVGADGENNGQGACTVVYSTGSGLTGTGARYFSQNTTGIAGTPENGDGFGIFF